MNTMFARRSTARNRGVRAPYAKCVDCAGVHEVTLSNGEEVTHHCQECCKGALMDMFLCNAHVKLEVDSTERILVVKVL